MLTALFKKHYYRSLQRSIEARKVASIHIEAYVAQMLVTLKRIVSNKAYYHSQSSLTIFAIYFLRTQTTILALLTSQFKTLRGRVPSIPDLS